MNTEIQEAAARYASMKQLRLNHGYPVSVMCKAFGVSRNGYYAWFSRLPTARQASSARLELAVKTASMGRKGNCYENTPIESFFGTLKNELAHHKRYKKRLEAMQEIREHIELLYNCQRRQARLGYLSPAAFEREFYQIK